MRDGGQGMQLPNSTNSTSLTNSTKKGHIAAPLLVFYQVISYCITFTSIFTTSPLPLMAFTFIKPSLAFTVLK